MEKNAKNKRLIGQVLRDGGFVSPSDIDFALEEQKRTSELLGQVLVRMKVLEPADINAVISVQPLLDEAKDVVQTAAGTRLMLGEMLVQAGHITDKQLDQALAEQKQTGEKLGEILMRSGLLTLRQLEGLLDFQQNQSVAMPFASPLRLGELLISSEVISREQLDDALQKQKGSSKKLGEVLVEEGYARPHHIKRGVRLQQMLVTAALVALLAACGGGGAADTVSTDSGAAATAQTAANVETDLLVTSAEVYDNQLTLTLDEYGLKKPNFFYSTNNNAFWSIQADIQDNLTDPNAACVIRIEIPKSEDAALPIIGGKTYSIEDNPLYEKFPGTFIVFNGEKSVLKKIESGIISFTPESTVDDIVMGSFDVMLTDYDSATFPAPEYHLTGSFNFKIGTYGPASTP
jgi:hypothetical protein